MRFVPFEICDSNGKPLPTQHPHVYIAVAGITRIVKEPSVDNVTYLDLGSSGVWVRGDYREIACMLNERHRKSVGVKAV